MVGALPKSGRARVILPRPYRLRRVAASSTSVRDCFVDLLDDAEADEFGVEARPHKGQRGLFATSSAAKDSVLLRVPLAACIDLDYDVGLNIRDAPWPLLKGALAAPDTPWDLLFALALLDARRGDGDPFWRAYTAAFLPAAVDLTLPFCQPPAALAALQHPQVADAALAQQARLAAAFPGVSLPPPGGGPTDLQWALACVRSRAFQLSASQFAYVPFLDLANHAFSATAGYRLAPENAPPAVELVALADIAAGEEVTISYTGPQGATNRRLLVQYGFVAEGNPGDRLDLGLVEGYIGTTPLRSNPGAGLSLSRLQDEMGDVLFSQMLSGAAPALLCAMKSLPTYDAVAAELPNPSGVLAAEATVVARLRDRLNGVAEEFETSEADDEALLVAGGLEGWERVAVVYRRERKRLARSAAAILKVYDRVLLTAS